MRPLRRRRLIMVLCLLAGAGLASTLALLALDQNLNLFYPPAQVIAGEAPLGKRIRAGGMVEEGTLVHGEDGLSVSFMVTDLRGASFEVRFRGILPDLFREGQGVIATGRLKASGIFEAETLLAKHDENYMPPELADMMPHAVPNHKATDS